MNYITIQSTKTPSTEVPPNVVQMFTDEEMYALARFVAEMLHNHGDSDSVGGRAAITFIQLMEQWENKTQ